jgi:Mor family transcriptional regulator
MGRKGSNRVTELVQQLIHLGTLTLVETFGCNELQAQVTMREIAHNLARSNGGEYLYVPKDQDFGLTKRDMAIYERMGKENVNDLAKEYGITARQLYSINRYVRDHLVRKRQGNLPGFDEPATPAA